VGIQGQTAGTVSALVAVHSEKRPLSGGAGHACVTVRGPPVPPYHISTLLFICCRKRRVVGEDGDDEVGGEGGEGEGSGGDGEGEGVASDAEEPVATGKGSKPSGSKPRPQQAQARRRGDWAKALPHRAVSLQRSSACTAGPRVLDSGCSVRGVRVMCV
jgi:hypothetical protein